MADDPNPKDDLKDSAQADLAAFAVDYPDATPPLPENAKADLERSARQEPAALAVDYPEPAESRTEWSDEPPRSKWSKRIRNLGRDPRVWFLLAMAVIFCVGFYQRCWRLDMPPYDYPADRQRSNIYTVEAFLNGGKLLGSLHAFHELALYPWLVAKTYSKAFHCEIYTWARLWSVFWGMVMVVFAAVAGYWSVAQARVSPTRRWWFALLFMAAVAFNPYHIGLSRITMTESMTLAFETMALAFFLMAMAKPRRIHLHILFVICFALAGLGKIPALIWLPGFALGYALNPKISKRWRVVGLVLMTIGMIAVFAIYRLNPFTMIPTFAKLYPGAYQTIHDWSGHELWYKAYFTRLAMMITVPGLIFGLIGMVVAPWVYRVTMAFALVSLYFLTGTNGYNFSHLILPGAALAIFGLNFVIEAGASRHLALGGRAQEPTPKQFLRLHEIWGAAIALLVIAIFLPMGPRNNLTAEPSGIYEQAFKVVEKYVPGNVQLLMNNDIFDYYLRTYYGRSSSKREQLDMSTGWFYSFDRITAVHDISRAWVKWASLPGEYGSLLLTDKPGLMDPIEMSRYTRLQKQPGAPVVEGLDLEAVLLPTDKLDAPRNLLRVEPGTSVSIGLQWNSTGTYKLARLVSRLDRWNQNYFPPPIREGGMIKGSGALLCVPGQGRQIVRYTFDFPKNFPAGQYAFLYYPISEESAAGDVGKVKAYGLPFVMEVAAGEPATEKVTHRVIDLYPDVYIWESMGWNDARSYKKMRLESITLAGVMNRVFPCPQSPAGKYRITLTGSGTPIYGEDPHNSWPTVDVFLPENPSVPVATVPFDSENTAEFTADFAASKPFDSVKLQVRTRGASAGRTPFWLIDFDRQPYGPEAIQYIHMNTVTLERQKPAK